MAVKKENIEIVKLLLTNNKLDINLQCRIEKSIEKKRTIIEMSPLQFAIDNNQDKIVKLLLSQENQSRIDMKDINKRSIKVTIENEIEVFERTALYISIEKKNADAIKALLSRAEIDVNEKSYHQLGNKPIEERAALHLAVEIGDLEIIKLLLEKKDIDINIEDSKNRKPLDYSSNDEIIKLLSQ